MESVKCDAINSKGVPLRQPPSLFFGEAEKSTSGTNIEASIYQLRLHVGCTKAEELKIVVSCSQKIVFRPSIIHYSNPLFEG